MTVMKRVVRLLAKGLGWEAFCFKSFIAGTRDD